MLKKLTNAQKLDVTLVTTPEIAAQYLAYKNKEIAKLVEKYGPCKLNWRKDRSSHFASIIETICYQQLAGKAAASIHGRVLGVLSKKVTPENIMFVDDTQLRAAGLSHNKILSVRSLAEHVIEKKLNLQNIWRYDDETVIELLTQVRGIGRWSAQMFLMERLKRLDVWPAGDYGVRAGAKELFKLKEMPNERAVVNMADKYKPFRSVVAWYCWKLADDQKR